MKQAVSLASMGLHVVISQKIEFSIVTAVRISNPTYISIVETS
jgi:hypothetical protein